MYERTQLQGAPPAKRAPATQLNAAVEHSLSEPAP